MSSSGLSQGSPRASGAAVAGACEKRPRPRVALLRSYRAARSLPGRPPATSCRPVSGARSAGSRRVRCPQVDPQSRLGLGRVSTRCQRRAASPGAASVSRQAPMPSGRARAWSVGLVLAPGRPRAVRFAPRALAAVRTVAGRLSSSRGVAPEVSAQRGTSGAVNGRGAAGSLDPYTFTDPIRIGTRDRSIQSGSVEMAITS